MSDLVTLARQLITEARAAKQDRYGAALSSHRGALRGEGDFGSEKFGGGIILQHDAASNRNPTVVHHPEHGSVAFPWSFPKGVHHRDDQSVKDYVASHWEKQTGNELDDKSVKAIASKIKQYMRSK